jgi:hypothetical protein
MKILKFVISLTLILKKKKKSEDPKILSQYRFGSRCSAVRIQPFSSSTD